MNYNMLVLIRGGEACLELSEPGLEVQLVVCIGAFALVGIAFEIEDSKILHITCSAENSRTRRLGQTRQQRQGEQDV